MIERKKGWKHSKETRMKISKSHMGKSSGMKGKHISEQHKKAIVNALRGIPLTEEHKRNMSLALKGHKTYFRTLEIRRRIAKTLTGRKRPDISKALKGRKFSKEHIEKIRLTRLGKKFSLETRKRMSEAQKGDKGSNWRGGLTPINKVIRHSMEYKLWRQAVLKRDNHTCIWCGVKGPSLNADHIKRFSEYPELRFAIDNGRTLCVKCHITTESYCKR